MKLYVKPSCDDWKTYLEQGAEGLLLPLSSYSSDYLVTFSLEEIENCCKENKPVFVIINKVVFDEEIEPLKEILRKLDSFGIEGVFFYDLALLELWKENSYSFDPVWNQTHMVTNTKTCDYYKEQGVSYGYLASEITMEEMKKIIEESKMEFFVLLSGHQIVAHSKRKLLKNYYSVLSKKEQNPITIEEPISHQKYDVYEDATGTTFFYHEPLNSSKALPLFSKMEVRGVLNEDFFSHSEFLRILSLYSSYQRDPKEETLHQLDQLLGDYTGFLEKKTIFKVKKHEED